MDYFNAFWVGGLICALVQILLDKTKLMPGRVMVLLVCTGSILGAIGIYQPLIDFAGAGAAVPLLGFGNTLWKGLKEAIDLNTRVTAELSIAMANIWNMESAQLMGMGEAGVMDAATAAEEEKFIKVIRKE